MDISDELRRINDHLEKIWEVVQHYPDKIGFANNLIAKQKFKRRTTKDDIKSRLIDIWNKEHPFHKLNH